MVLWEESLISAGFGITFMQGRDCQLIELQAYDFAETAGNEGGIQSFASAIRHVHVVHEQGYLAEAHLFQLC